MDTEESKRKEQRVPYSGNVVINHSIRCKGIDISENGLYVYTGRSFHKGSTVHISFAIRHLDMEAEAVVQFNQSGVGMGLMFSKIRNDDKERIQSYIAHTIRTMSEDELYKKRIAFVYDTSPLMMHHSALIHAGFSVHELKKEPGLYRNLIEGHKPDLIILYLELRSEEDFELIRLLRSSEDFKDTPIIVLSGSNQPMIDNRVITEGAAVFLQMMTASPKKLEDTVIGLFRRNV